MKVEFSEVRNPEQEMSIFKTNDVGTIVGGHCGHQMAPFIT